MMTIPEKRILDWIRTGVSCEHQWITIDVKTNDLLIGPISGDFIHEYGRPAQEVIFYQVCKIHALPIQCKHESIRAFDKRYKELLALHNCNEFNPCSECKVYKVALEKEWYEYWKTITSDGKRSYV